ncbi:MAG: Nif11-like leader peptide family natural product precursor [Cyanosarcina radialis HA8281-LM2]|jgi:predicted ribosomally synthesized peptide with nif11-like leader|nr:Nif11-like leader peptide family natural product precursor [Cyanosarcina radialis HA8281-LM2]
MAQESAAKFFKAVQNDEALQQKCKAIADSETFVRMAEDRGYHFTVEELQTAIESLSAKEVAAVINPGVGPRQHLVPR